MKLKLSVFIIAFICLCATAAAQVDNCCFAGWQCNSDKDWVDGFYAFQHGQCSAPAQPQATSQSASIAPAQIDNCCFAGWQCTNDLEWIKGYHAYLNGQCAAPAQTPATSPTQPTSNAAGQVDNCCFAGWQCNTGQEWINGYHAYQNNQCTASPALGGADNCCALGWNCTFDFDFIMARWVYADNNGWCNAPIQELFDGVILEGSPEFIAEYRRAMHLIKGTAPEWYAYVLGIIQKIRESPGKTGYGTLHKSFNMPIWSTVGYTAGVIIHETCHVHRSFAGVHTHDLENIAEEAICDQVAINSLQQISPSTHYPRGRIDDFFALGHNWDIGPSVQREWDRARHIYAQAN